MATFKDDPQANLAKIEQHAEEKAEQRVTTKSDTADNHPSHPVPAEMATLGAVAAPIWVPLDQIDDHPSNIRLVYDDEQISAIATQIRERGYEPQHAIVVRLKADGRFECDSGHTRMRGARKAGLYKILVIVAQLDDDEAYLRLGTENVHSEVTSMEWGIWAAGFELANGQRRCGLKEAAKQIGKSYETLVRFRRGALVFLAHRDHCPGAMTLLDKAVHLSLLYDLSSERQRYWLERLIAENISREKLHRLIVTELNPEEKKSKAARSNLKATAAPLVASDPDVAPEQPGTTGLTSGVERAAEHSGLAHGRELTLTELTPSAASDPSVDASAARVDGDCDCICPPNKIPGYDWIFVEGLLKGARRVLPSTDVAGTTGDDGADGDPKFRNLSDFRILDPSSLSSTAGSLSNIGTSAGLGNLLARVASGPIDQVTLILGQSHAEIRAAIRDTGFRLYEPARVTAERARPLLAGRPCLVALGEPSAATVKQRVRGVGLGRLDANGSAMEEPIAVATPDGLRTVSYDDLRWDSQLGLLYVLVALNDNVVASVEPLTIQQA